MRLIDADKLKKELDCWARVVKKPNLYSRDDAIYIIESQPTVNQWIKFTTIFDEETGTDILSCEMPEEDQEILVTDGVDVWMDTFLYDGKGWYLDTNCSLCDEVIAWMPKPQPYKGE